MLDPELEETIRHGMNSRNGLRQRKRLWTSRIIPYHIPSWMSMYLRSGLLNVFVMLWDKAMKALVRFLHGECAIVQVKELVRYSLNYY